MSRFRHYKYYGTPDAMPEKEAYHCAKYIKRNQENIVVIGRFLIDTEALRTPFNLDCFQCRLVHRETCCENGQPYAVDQWQVPLLEQAAPTITENYFSPIAQKQTEQYGIWGRDRVPGTLRLQHGSCIFFTEINGVHCCSIHAHAEANSQEVYPVKPFSCQLYPIDLIDLGEQILITAVNPQTAPFSRWGTDYLDNFYCANLERRKQANHIDGNLFAIDQYRPAYQWGLTTIEHAFGKEAAEAVEGLMNTR